jgi:hypothetical protein
MTFNKIIVSVTLVVFSLSSLAAPTITTTAGTAATSGIAYNYTASATDSNSQPLTWTAPTLPSWLTFSATGNAQAVDFVSNAGGTPGGVGYDEATGLTYYGTLGGTTIYKVDAAGNKSAFGVQPSDCYPYGSFVVRNSRLYVPCYGIGGSGSIVSYDLTVNTGNAAATNLLTGPGWIALAVRNDVLYATNYDDARVYTINWSTGARTSFWDTAANSITGPYGMVFDTNGDLYVTDYNSGVVKKRSTGGAVTNILNTNSYGLTDIKKGLNGKFYISNSASNLKIYPSDFSTPETVNVLSWGMTFNSAGTLILGNKDSKLLKIETGAVLYGTPSVANVGVHPVSLSVTDGSTAAVQNFSITVIAAPSVTTGSASGLTATGATLGGTVSSNGAASTVTFEYGLTTPSYGSTATAAESPLASSASAASVSASITGLTCGTTYHYRVKAVNSVNTTYGSDATFSTGSCQTNAVCGTAASMASSIVPTGNLCTAGTAGQVSSSQGQYSWTCSGTGGGTNASCAAPWATNAGTGSGSLSASGNGWTVSSASFAATPTATPPAGVTFPNGILDLQLSTGTAGTDATVVVQYTTAVPAGAVYIKYGKTAANQTDHWYQLDASRAVFASDRMSVTLTLTDGGAGDHDLLANGTIVDPGGPALVPAPTAVPTLSEWAMIFLASLMGMFAFARIRRQS